MTTTSIQQAAAKPWTLALFTASLLNAGAALTIVDNNGTVPGSAFLSNSANASFTRVTDSSASPAGFTRGQTLTTPDTADANTQWGLTAITIQMRVGNAGNSVPTVGSNPMRMRIFEWGNPQGLNPGSEIYNQSGDFPLNAAGADFITFDLGESVALDENASYGFLLSWDTATGNDVFVAIAANSGSSYDGGILWLGNENSVRTDQDLTFHLHGSPVPEPSIFLLVAFAFGIGMRRRR